MIFCLNFVSWFLNPIYLQVKASQPVHLQRTFILYKRAGIEQFVDAHELSRLVESLFKSFESTHEELDPILLLADYLTDRQIKSMNVTKLISDVTFVSVIRVVSYTAI